MLREYYKWQRTSLEIEKRRERNKGRTETKEDQAKERDKQAYLRVKRKAEI